MGGTRWGESLSTGPILQALLHIFLLPGKIGGALCTGGLGSVFNTDQAVLITKEQ